MEILIMSISKGKKLNRNFKYFLNSSTSSVLTFFHSCDAFALVEELPFYQLEWIVGVLDDQTVVELLHGKPAPTSGLQDDKLVMREGADQSCGSRPEQPVQPA